MSADKHIEEHVQLPPSLLLPIKCMARVWELAGAQKITIGAAAGAGTNYQVKLAVTAYAVFNDGITIGVIAARSPAKNDSGSLRFYTSTGALIPMFVESVFDEATVWLKIPDDLSTTDVDIYLLDNGDAAAANVSDGNAVFELFDGFNAGSLDTAKWDATFATGVTFAGSGEAAYALFTGADAQRGLKSVASFGDGHEMLVSGRYPNASAGGNASIVGFDAQYYFYNPSTDLANSYIGKGAYLSSHVSQGSLISNSANYTVKTGRSGGTGRVVSVNNVGVAVTTNSTGVSTTAAPAMANCVYATGTTARIDYIFVKKFVATEPVVSAVTQLIGQHDHADDAGGGSTIRPSAVVCSGQMTAVAPAGQTFGYAVTGLLDWDAHGYIVNVVVTNPTVLNKIGNIRYSVNGLPRWTIKKTDALEDGGVGVAGSDLEFLPSDNGGNAKAANSPVMSRDGRFSVVSTPPATAASAGRAGSVTWDASYIYICVATNTWKRVAIATW